MTSRFLGRAYDKHEILETMAAIEEALGINSLADLVFEYFRASVVVLLPTYSTYSTYSTHLSPAITPAVAPVPHRVLRVRRVGTRLGYVHSAADR